MADKKPLDVHGQGLDTAKDKLVHATAKRLPRRVQYWAAIADLMAFEER